MIDAVAMSTVRIIEEGMLALQQHGTIPISFRASTRLKVDVALESHGQTLLTEPVAPFSKDYDAFEDERPSRLSKRFDVSHWGLLSAFDEQRRLGGIVVAVLSPGMDMLEGRDDLALLADVRVHPDFRGKGVGRALFTHVSDWARRRGCTELKVETQDINVGACRFYAAMGFSLASVARDAYGPEIDETQLIWRRGL